MLLLFNYYKLWGDNIIFLSNSKCIKNVVDYLGVTIKTLLNYIDAINEIEKTDENEKCNYYIVWLMYGPEINRLPDNSKYSGLVELFIDCLLFIGKMVAQVFCFVIMSLYISKQICFLKK